jgi:hypothetical protein
MKAIQKGDKGDQVKKWQYFLYGQGYKQIVADGIFGFRTHEATLDFQKKNGLKPDGIAGTFTLAKAGMIGFELVKIPPGNDPYGINWPPRPAFRCLSQQDYPRLFGKFSWKLKPDSKNGHELLMTCNWEKDHIVILEMPVLKNTPPYYTSRIKVHQKVARQFENLFTDWENEGLMDLILSYDGSFNPRMIRGTDNKLSSHSYGIAIDINASWNSPGIIPPGSQITGSVRKLVETANRNGFFWGGHFKRYDGMHFEIARILS